MHIHLDLIGGLAGDMFIAALLDAFPRHERSVLDAVRMLSAQAPVFCSLSRHTDGVLQGRRFTVKRLAASSAPMAHPAHAHASWKDIRRRIEDSALEADVKRHAIGIFELVAQAEAAVHGMELEDVAFHEVGAWDSIADVIGAATLIGSVAASGWSCSAAPLGSGRVRTAHGILPVPAPATVQLLMGMDVIDDGIPGERVTPTGAAILRYLCPPDAPTRNGGAQTRRLNCSGIGFGMRQLPGISNHLRVLCFDDTAHPVGGRELRELHVIEFEVDDQSGEDLAMGLDRLRALDSVLDVTQSPVFGKKGRMMARLTVLVRTGFLDQAVDACFRETTTIGLRHRKVHGIGLPRSVVQGIDVDGRAVRVKIAERPGGRTAKTEADDVSTHAEHARRIAIRERAERLALSMTRQSSDA